jgi:hypothetical protein
MGHVCLFRAERCGGEGTATPGGRGEGTRSLRLLIGAALIGAAGRQG